MSFRGLRIFRLFQFADVPENYFSQRVAAIISELQKID